MVNPFYKIVTFFSKKYEPLTNEQLDYISIALYHALGIFKTREEAFQVIQYLAENGVLDLVKNEDSTFSVKLKEN